MHGTRSCKGGTAQGTLDWIINTSDGLDYATDYSASYNAKRGKCAATSAPPQASLSAYAWLDPNNETAMLDALTYGPIGAQVTVDA